MLPGEGGVSATGEYQYRIPVEAPAGRAGVQPSLALVHGSRGGNGHLGVGRQLHGLSEINRCARTFATEGHADGVRFEYESRADRSVAYLHGVAFKTTVRLKSILLDAPDPVAPALLWRYDLADRRTPRRLSGTPVALLR